MLEAMLFDLLSLVLLAIFAVLGALRGALRSGVRLLCWILGYAGAVVLGPALEPVLSQGLGVTPPLSLIAAGTAVLLSVWLLGWIAIRTAESRRDPEHRSAWDQPVGGLFGALQGGLLVLLVGWLGLWLDAASRLGASLPVEPPKDSVTAQVTGAVAERALDLAVGEDADPGVRMAARVAARPGDSVEKFQALLENPRIAALRDDATFWSYMRHGAVDAALNRGSFLGIAHDDTLRRELADLGVVGEAAAADPRLFRNEVRGVAGEVSTRVKWIADSPEARALASDPDVQTALERGDTAGLLAHPGVRKLIARALSTEPPAEL
jgi:uncharacterized membrane protein required for colicin V production